MVFAGTVLLLLTLLCMAAKIPREAIRPHSLESAEYMCEGDLYAKMVKNTLGTEIDHYADSILLNIAWNYEREYTLRSVLLSAYYYSPEYDENVNYLLSVREGGKANQQYLRYWHGSIAIVRPLLILMSVRGIYILNAILLFVLFAAIMVILIRKHEPAPALGLLLGSIFTRWYVAPLALEYIWMCLLSLVSCLVILSFHTKAKQRWYGYLFMIVGITANYLDFLTTETLTLTLPLLLLLWLERKNGESLRTTLKATLMWGIGYIGMWIAKWLLTALVFGEDVRPYVTEHIAERLGGDVGVSLPLYLIMAVYRNIACTFPFSLGIPGVIAAVIILFVAVALGIIYRCENIDKKLIILIIMAGAVPFVRYLVLHNHSYVHYFFTYRALAATVLAFVLILAELLGSRPWRKRHAGED